MNPLMPDVTVNGETISAAAIAAEAQNHNAPSAKPGWAWQAAARALILRSLLLQEAAKMGLKADPQHVATDKVETEDEALIRQVLDVRMDAAEVSEADCKTIYDAQPGRFCAPSLFQPSHILLAAKPDDIETRAKAKSNAVAFIKTLRKTPKAFADIAKNHSDCPSKNAAGSLGQIGSGDTVPEFEAVLDILNAGEIHPEPVETRFGIHIIRMDEKAVGAVLPFDAVMPQIKEKLEQINWMKSAQALSADLVEAAEISGIDLNKQRAA